MLFTCPICCIFCRSEGICTRNNCANVRWNRVTLYHIRTKECYMVSDLLVYFFILGPNKNMFQIYCCVLYCYTQIHKNDKFVKFAPRMYFSLLLQFLKCPEWLCLWFVFIVLFLFYCHMVLFLAFQLFVNHTQLQHSVDLWNIVKNYDIPFLRNILV